MFKKYLIGTNLIVNKSYFINFHTKLNKYLFIFPFNNTYNKILIIYHQNIFLSIKINFQNNF